MTVEATSRSLASGAGAAYHEGAERLAGLRLSVFFAVKFALAGVAGFVTAVSLPSLFLIWNPPFPFTAAKIGFEEFDLSTVGPREAADVLYTRKHQPALRSVRGV